VEGVKLPLALAELGLIDEYEFVVQPSLVGHGPTLFAGLSKRVELRLVSRLEFGSGAVAMRYEQDSHPSERCPRQSGGSRTRTCSCSAFSPSAPGLDEERDEGGGGAGSDCTSLAW
jgi:RibD C-terminal domain